jgi:signal transduction histidine kinase
VQEALTNALRYASDARRVEVEVDTADDATVVTIADDGGRDRAGDAPSVGAGRGLVGMSERAAVFGGSVEAGPIATGGWRVRAVLPGADRGADERRASDA